MTKDKSLKEQNAWLIRAMVLAHIVVFACITLEPFKLMKQNQAVLLADIEKAAAPSTAALGFIMLAALVLLGIIPSRWRDRLIHWRWRYPLPGSRAFTDIGPQGNRIDMSVIETRYGSLPNDPGKQDRLFYKIYFEYRDQTGVLDAHRSYLAMRDVGTMNAILFIVLPLLSLWATGNWYSTLLYAAVLFVSYLIFSLAAQNYGTRMVENVLALASLNGK